VLTTRLVKSRGNNKEQEETMKTMNTVSAANWGATVESTNVQTQQWKRAVWTAFFGFFIDFFDLYLPIIVLAPAYVYFKPADLSSPILESFVFASALLGRPLGALVFGYWSDRMGRKRISMIAMAGSAATVFLTALLPGYESVGLLSISLLVALRFFTGFFVGGQYTGAVTLAMEACPGHRRGYYAALVTSSGNLSFVVMALIGMAVLQFFPSGGIDAPYTQIGWRIPFIAGAIMAVIFLSYIRRHLQESEVWLHSEKKGSPLASLFSSVRLGSDLFQGFLLMIGLWLIYFVPAAILPPVLRVAVKLSPFQVTQALLVGSIVAVFGFLVGGITSDRIGRRAAFIWFGLASATIGTLLTYVVVQMPNSGLWSLFICFAAMFGIVGLVWGSGPHSYLNERFHTGSRSSGYGIVFSFSVILPSFYGIYQTWLGKWMLPIYTPAALLFIGSLIVILAAAWGPETKSLKYIDDRAKH
jgi:MFS family permease